MKHNRDRVTIRAKQGQHILYYLSISAMLWAVSPPHTYAQFIIPANDGTGTQVIQDNRQFTINGGRLSGNGRNLFHSFTEFGLNQGQTATFLSTPAIQTILTRVTGSNPSFIDGLLRVSGGNSHFVLMNPAGILFGANASLNVPASFTATTANQIRFGSGEWWRATGVNDYVRLNGVPAEFAFTTDTPGAIANLGALSVPSGQSLTLLAGSVLNQGQLIAPGGQVTVASVTGQSLVKLSQTGSLLSLEVKPLVSGEVGRGEVSGRSLPQLLTGGNLVNATQVSVNPDGTLQLAGSKAILPTAPGTTLMSGQVSVSQGATSAPGSINVLGQNVALIGAKVDASGLQGGTIRIGGDQRGQGAIPNARMTTIDPTTVITANSLAFAQPADGGRVTVWADDTTRFYGTIQARGGPNGGDGGFVEVSGRQNLLYRGQADVTAPVGQAGTLLLDPTNIRIVPGRSAINDPELFADGQIFASDPGGTFTISQGALEAATGNVVLEATNDIVLALPSFSNVVFSSGALSVTFRADADGDGAGNFIAPRDVSFFTALTAKTDITIEAANISMGNINTDVVTGEAGNVSLSAIQTIRVGDIVTSGDVRSGDVTLVSGGQITTGNIITNATGVDGIGGNVTLISDFGEISTGNIVTSGDWFSGDVTLLSLGQITTGNIFTDATGIDSFGGNVTLISDFDGISTGAIVTSGDLLSGSVYLAAASDWGTVRFASIDTASFLGDAGDVVIQAGLFVQGTDVIDPFSNLTIDTFGEFLSGVIVIEHGGGGLGVPFVIGAPTINGTVGGISTSFESFDPPPAIAFRGNYISPSGTIQILTNGDPTGGRGLPFELIDLDFEEIFSDFEEEGEEEVFGFQDQSLDTTEEPVEAETEQGFTEDFQAYLELPDQPTVRLDVGDTLQQVASETGVKSALVYLNFVPANVATESSASTERLSQIKPTNAVKAWNPGSSGALTAANSAVIWQFEDVVQNRDRLQTQLVDAPRRTNGQGSDQLEILIVTGDGQPLRKMVAGVTRDRVQTVVKEFVNEAADPRKTRSQNYLAPAQQLYRWLVQPIEAELQTKGIGNLAFIADAGLRFIPFAALHDGQQFLIEKYSLGLMPSFGLTNPRFASLKQARILAMGASEFAEKQPLPAVPTELSAITRGAQTGRTFLNQEFTLTNLQTQRQQEPFKIVHLATHGEFQPGALDNSYIQLWDTRLRLNQLRQLSWNNPPVELLVLSACRTALGSEEAELGFAGFAVQAGVKSALASLWSVSDEGTLGLMTEFYRQLELVPIRAEALRQAQLAMVQGRVRIENGRLYDSMGKEITLPPTLADLGSINFRHPYYWAAFTMIGSPW